MHFHGTLCVCISADPHRPSYYCHRNNIVDYQYHHWAHSSFSPSAGEIFPAAFSAVHIKGECHEIFYSYIVLAGPPMNRLKNVRKLQLLHGHTIIAILYSRLHLF